MNTPPGLLGSVVLFWGWHSGFLLPAAILAPLLEASRLVPRRWDFSRADLNRISDLCTIVFLGIAGYLVVTRDVTHALLGIFEWLPLTFLPLVGYLAYSTGGKIDLSVFSMSWRRRVRSGGPGRMPARSIDLSYPYVALCLISASATNVRTPWFYAGVCALAAWALWYTRCERFSPLVWAGLLASVSAMGYGGHVALDRLQTVLEDALEHETDPYRSQTAIGQIGTLKLSDRIALRVEPNEAQRPPILLREASYNMYHASRWFALESGFNPVQPEADGTTWTLRPGAPPNQSMTITAQLKRGKGMLALPNGALQIEGLPIAHMQRNPLGAVKVEEGVRLITYQVRFGPDTALAGPPQELDLKIPKREAPIISRVAADLGLADQTPGDVLKTLATFFQQNFRYSTFLAARQLRTTPLEDFLLRSRSGHCEYFATATVLLLRAAGLPARYATGYSVQEFSRLEHMYVARARHAHAWALVYIDGAWHDFDTTPASWFGIEEQGAWLSEPLVDLWSRGVYLLSKWRWGGPEGSFTQRIRWLLIPLVALLTWRLTARKRRMGASRTPLPPLPSYPGEDSEFYRLEKRLQELGLARHPWEPLPRWMQRITATQEPTAWLEPLSTIVSLHYRYRFDPHGISPTERAALKAHVQAWLEQHREM